MAKESLPGRNIKRFEVKDSVGGEELQLSGNSFLVIKPIIVPQGSITDLYCETPLLLGVVDLGEDDIVALEKQRLDLLDRTEKEIDRHSPIILKSICSCCAGAGLHPLLFESERSTSNFIVPSASYLYRLANSGASGMLYGPGNGADSTIEGLVVYPEYYCESTDLPAEVLAKPRAESKLNFYLPDPEGYFMNSVSGFDALGYPQIEPIQVRRRLFHLVPSTV